MIKEEKKNSQDRYREDLEERNIEIKSLSNDLQNKLEHSLYTQSNIDERELKEYENLIKQNLLLWEENIVLKHRQTDIQLYEVFEDTQKTYSQRSESQYRSSNLIIPGLKQQKSGQTEFNTFATGYTSSDDSPKKMIKKTKKNKKKGPGKCSLI